MRAARLLRTGALATAVAFALSACGFHGLYNTTLPGGTNVGSHPFKVTIEFANVLDLVPQSNVKVNDVAVGKVTDIKIDPTNQWAALVTVQVNGNVKLPENARAEVQMTSLLGEKYVALEQPIVTGEGTLHNGSKIPLTATGTAPEVEEVLGALSLLLNGGGFEQIQTITTELNKALKGNSGAVHDLLRQLNTFVGGLDTQKTEITDALTNIDKLAATLNANKTVIAQALDTFPQALQILKDDRTKFTQLLSSLSHLGSVATSLLTFTPEDASSSVQTLFVESLKTLDPVLQSLTAAGTDLPNALKLLLTYPFPVGKSLEFVKGDYANLNAFLNLNLDQNLCSVSSVLCVLEPGNTSQPASASESKTASTKSIAARALPAIPGLGG